MPLVTRLCVAGRLGATSALRLSRSMSDSRALGPMESAIRQKLTAQLRPTELVITNDSHLHSHHSAMRAIGGGTGETHFSLVVVSPEFEGKRTMQRHRMVYAALAEELQGTLHALALQTRTPQEVAQAAEQATSTA